MVVQSTPQIPCGSFVLGGPTGHDLGGKVEVVEVVAVVRAAAQSIDECQDPWWVVDQVRDPLVDLDPFLPFSAQFEDLIEGRVGECLGRGQRSKAQVPILFHQCLDELVGIVDAAGEQ